MAGTEPFRLLEARSSSSILRSCSNSLGMVPFNLLLRAAKKAKYARVSMDVGIEPSKVLA